MTEIIVIEGKAKLLFDGSTYEPVFWMDSIECRSPKDGSMIMSTAKWKSQQKWFVSLESAVKFITDQVMLEKPEYLSLFEYIKEYNKIFNKLLTKVD